MLCFADFELYSYRLGDLILFFSPLSKGCLRSLTSFHADSRYGGDLHRADMAWALHAAARGISREQIEHEILNGRDLSKKGPPLRPLLSLLKTPKVSKRLAI
jgi:hypothetical protein